eukprot:1089940-Prymnesium_polylepis.1
MQDAGSSSPAAEPPMPRPSETPKAPSRRSGETGQRSSGSRPSMRSPSLGRRETTSMDILMEGSTQMVSDQLKQHTTPVPIKTSENGWVIDPRKSKWLSFWDVG